MRDRSKRYIIQTMSIAARRLSSPSEIEQSSANIGHGCLTIISSKVDKDAKEISYQYKKL